MSPTVRASEDCGEERLRQGMGGTERKANEAFAPNGAHTFSFCLQRGYLTPK